jgi:ABC-type Zn2+ transport system substrate-binding protein/surface adhesin
MPDPIPEKVKTTLSELTGAQQVVLRGYIATLREEIKGLEEKIRAADEPDPHAHYHGHEKCTADHGHDGDHHQHDETDPHEHHDQ